MRKQYFLIFAIFFIVVLFFPIGVLSQSGNLSGYPVNENGFYENKGQISDQNYKPNPAVKYLLCSRGFNVQLRQTGFSYDTYTDSFDGTNSENEPLTPPGNGRKLPKKFSCHYHRVDVELLDCNRDAAIKAEGKSGARYNYYTASTTWQTGGITNVHCYTKITYKNIYPHIDLVFFVVPVSKNETGRKAVEYNFIVHPGGNPADIKLAYKGANKIFSEGNRLIVSVSAGDFTESIPDCYLKNSQRLSGGQKAIKQTVQVNYAALGNNVFTFSLPPWLMKGKLHTDLVIDPFPYLDWGTYYGETDLNYGQGIALDDSDNVYITGYTNASSGIATSGAYQTTFGGGSYDAIIAKFNPTGSALRWATYYGGAGADIGYGIAVDASRNAYITGYTSSTSGIATTGAWKTALGAEYNAFVAKFSSVGSLVWGTYYGDVLVTAYGIALDASDNVYITGNTYSGAEVTTSGAYQTTFGGNADAFVAKFNSSGSTLIWGSLFGGSGVDGGYGIAVDASENVYITGQTQSTSGIATGGAYKTTLTGSANAFVAKFNSSGSSLLWGTYFGGTATDQANGIAVDASDNAYITGFTSSSSGIATLGAHQTTYGGAQDAFVAKINSTGASLAWGTYYGGSGLDNGTGIVLDDTDNVYITGYTASASGIATPGAYQTSLTGSQNCFLAKLNTTGSTLKWATYYGGTQTDEATAVAMDGSGDLYITGNTSSSSGITTGGVYESSYGGSGDDDDAFVAKFAISLSTTSPLPITLTHFTANYMEQSNSVLVDWTVASQLNNKEFVIEKTLDGINYEDVATVPGAGTTAFSESYSAVDNNPVPGISYYRLKQVDWDGNTTVFSPAAVFIGNYQNTSLNIYPNPVNSCATLVYIATDKNPVTVNILDITGRIVSSVSINNVHIGENNFNLNTSSLSRGIYFIVASDEGGQVYRLKFVKE